MNDSVVLPHVDHSGCITVVCCLKVCIQGSYTHTSVKTYQLFKGFSD